MNKQEIEELRKSVNLRLANSKYKDAFLDVSGDLDCISYIKWQFQRNSEEYDLIGSKIDNYPSLSDWIKENSDSISIIYGNYIEENEKNFIEITISFNGKNISGSKIPASHILEDPKVITRNSSLIAVSTETFANKYLFSSILDENCKDNKTSIDFIKRVFTYLKDLKQIAARIELSAALFGDELVNQVLEKCGVMNLKELRFAAED